MYGGFQDSQFNVQVMNDNLLKLKSNRNKLNFLLDYKSHFIEKYGIPTMPQPDNFELGARGENYYLSLIRFYEIICVKLEEVEKLNSKKNWIERNPIRSIVITAIISPMILKILIWIIKLLQIDKYLGQFIQHLIR